MSLTKSALSSSIAFALLVSCTAVIRSDQTRHTAIVGVTVVPMDSSRILRDQTIVVRDGVISAIGPRSSTKIPQRARRIDGANAYVLPGLIDTHVHLRHPSELLSYLSYGVTTVVHLSGSTPNGLDVFALRAAVASGTVIGPTIYASGRILDGEPLIQAAVSTPVRNEREAREAVTTELDAGADFVKVYNNVPAAALRGAVDASHARGAAVFGHIPRIDGREGALQRALDAGLDVIAHGEEYFFTFFYADVEQQLDAGSVPRVDERKIPQAVQLTRAAGTAVIPNLSFVAMTRAQLDDLSAVLAHPEFRFLSPAVQQMWRQHNPTTRANLDRFDRRERAKYPFVQKLTAALSAGNVPLFLGTDASAPGLFPGHSAHTELEELVKAGLEPEDAFVAATRAPGEFISRRTRTVPFGTIAIGKRADMIVLRRNPIENVANLDSLTGVMVRGRWFTIAELQRLRIASPQ